MTILIPFTVETYKCVEEYIREKPEDYRWPEFGDFWFTGVTSVILFAVERLFDYIFYPFFYKHCKEKVNLEARDMRTKKACSNLFKLFYYSLALIFGYVTLKDSYILPPFLGGSGSFYN